MATQNVVGWGMVVPTKSISYIYDTLYLGQQASPWEVCYVMGSWLTCLASVNTGSETIDHWSIFTDILTWLDNYYCFPGNRVLEIITTVHYLSRPLGNHKLWLCFCECPTNGCIGRVLSLRSLGSYFKSQTFLFLVNRKGGSQWV